MSVFDEVLAAHHEAAHVVAALAFPELIALHDATITGGAGKVRYWLREQSKRAHAALAVLLLAGIEADEDDLDGPAGDETQLAGVLDRLNLRGAARSRQTGRWRAEAVAILHRERRLVESIANRLVAVKRLTAAEIATIAVEAS